MIWWTYLIRQTLCTIGSLERLFLQNLLYLEEWIRNSYNMKGTWQARSLSAGKWANCKRLDFRLTGRQIDSWPARSLSCYLFHPRRSQDFESESDIVKNLFSSRRSPQMKGAWHSQKPIFWPLLATAERSLTQSLKSCKVRFWQKSLKISSCITTTTSKSDFDKSPSKFPPV